ncbi:PhoH family protein, partial [bacterium]|nr:PhoH family protein [bacterium]
DNLYNKPFKFDPGLWNASKSWLANQYLILKNGSKSALGRYCLPDGLVRRVYSPESFNIKPRNAEQCFALDAATNKNIRLVSLTGKAGTGKTLLALLSSLQVRSDYLQIFMTRPTVPLSNKDSGFLPGDISAKLDPYMKPLYDNLTFIKYNKEKNGQGEKGTHLIDRLENEGKMIIEPLSYIRGRSLPRIFFIIDEAQNLTPHEIKTIVTRAGEGTKLVFTGDIHQIDHPYLTSRTNGLSYLIEKMKGQSLYAHVHLEKGERSELANLASELL